jgi:hypothetical protein
MMPAFMRTSSGAVLNIDHVQHFRPDKRKNVMLLTYASGEVMELPLEEGENILYALSCLRPEWFVE